MICPDELEIKDTIESEISDIDCNRRLTTTLYDKRDDFDLVIVNFSFLFSNAPLSPAYGVYVSQLIRYIRTCHAYGDFLKQDQLTTKKLMLQGYNRSRLKSSFSKSYGRYNAITNYH